MTSPIGHNLFGFQAALRQSGSNLNEYLEKYYYKKWVSDELYAAMAIRTTFVNALHLFFEEEGLFNLERLQMSMVTDPLAHDVEHTPSISYKGQAYVMTHSMIYSKFLACNNPKIKGVFVDSPNIRLELESLDRVQRGKYLIDFSQMDVELRRNRQIDYETYLQEPEKVKEILSEDMEKVIDMFERMLMSSLSRILEKNQNELELLGVTLELPEKPFPRFKLDEIKKKYGSTHEINAGKEVNGQFFWIVGLLRENYDLIYPYITPGAKISMNDITSGMIYNFDICAKSINRDTGEQSPALEILSGAIREWLFEAIVERLIDNKIILERPIIEEGNLINIDKLGGYGPFLLMASKNDANGRRLFPDTMGGGIGIERTLYSILRGPKIKKIDDITCFGKNPDSHQIFMF